MGTALLLVDVQNDYFSGGRMELSRGPETVARIRDLLNLFRNLNFPVVHMRNIYVRPESSLYLPDTIGTEIHHDVLPVDGEKEILKNYPNSFRGTELDGYLREIGIRRLVIVGMMTHMCIDSTVRAAFDLGYQCIVPEDCCATRSLSYRNVNISSDELQRTFLASLDGVFAEVVKRDDVYNLLRRYEHLK